MSQRRRARHAARPRIPFVLAAAILVVAVGAVVAWRLELWPAPSEDAVAAPSPSVTIPSPTAAPTTSAPPTPTAAPSPEPANTAFEGITTFRGNQTRTYYGSGPVPMHPRVIWRYPPEGSLCSTSTDQHGAREWCGTGWTGQPNVIVGEHGKIEVRINAYDGAYHFLNGKTGEPVRPALQTGDLAKGSASSDPDGYPLYYAGSRDNLFRVIALDRPEPTVLWDLNAETSVPNPVWNDDWDGAPLVVGDYLLEGGENSWFYVIRLHRGYDDRGLVTVRPKVVLTVPGFDDELLAALPDSNVSIESSVAFRDGDRVLRELGRARPGVGHLARPPRRVQGRAGLPVLDRRGHGRERRDRRGRVPVRGERARAVHGPGPRGGPADEARPPAPERSPRVVVRDPRARSRGRRRRLGHPGAVRQDDLRRHEPRGPDRARTPDGDERWRIHLAGPTWSSPVPIDDVLLQGDCGGTLHAFDISKPFREPPELWSLSLGSCIESTPSVLEDMIWVGTRGGGVYGIADRKG